MLYTSENLGGTLLTTLGGNQDDTVGTAGSVEGCGRRILEYRETLDVIGAQTAWFDAQSRVIDAEIDLRMSRLALMKATGEMN